MVKGMVSFVKIDGWILCVGDDGAEVADGVIDGVKVVEVTCVVLAEGSNKDAHTKTADDEPEGVEVFTMGIDGGGFGRVLQVER